MKKRDKSGESEEQTNNTGAQGLSLAGMNKTQSSNFNIVTPQINRDEIFSE
jgi:hypothetical protein